MKKSALVWDLPTRLFHWALVAGVGYAWFAIEILEDLQQHFYAGYTVLTLLLFRLAWGFIGSPYARFAHFLYSPRIIVEYVKTLSNTSSHSPRNVYLGHNPVGGLSVFAMLAVLFLQTGTGLFSSDDYYFGPLAGLVSEAMISQLTSLHHLNFDLITVLVALHILAIIFYRLYKKQPLTKAMFTGTKMLQDGVDVHDEQNAGKSNLLLAAIVLVLSIAAVYLVANSFTDLLPTGQDDYGF